MIFRRKRKRRKPVTAASRQRRELARPLIAAKVEHWAGRLGVQPKRVAIRDQRSRWGSASSLGNLNFNWRITAMPEEIFDYIIIHELAHLREMNHSLKFWRIVAEHAPNYKTHRAWLRRNGTKYHRVVV